jgi:hypothetical protein
MADLSIINHLRKQAPSIFATEAFGKMSDKYKFIPTIDVVEALAKEGFTPSKVFESSVRSEEKRGYAKHLIRFRNIDILPQVGELIPEIVLTNSHDGSSAFQLSAGLYRLVCSNGLTVGADQFSVRQRHSGKVDDVIEGVFSLVDEFPAIADTAREWQGTRLTPEQQLALATAALPLRWTADEDGKYPVEASQLLRLRRRADASADLWSTFNVIQENIIKGGVRARTSTGVRRASTAVKSVDGDQRLNKALWTLAAEMSQLTH